MRGAGFGLASAALLAGCFQTPASPPAAASQPATATIRPAVPAAELLEAQPAPVVAAMMREAADPGIRSEAVYALAGFGGEAQVPAIGEALRDPDARVRSAAVDVLSTMGGELPAALLAQALNDPDPEMRLRAAEAFGDIEGPAAELALRQAVTDADGRVREAAAELLQERSAVDRDPD